eukprot:TRINITY_DN7673_c1_g1_i1.p1 TRINITY_DN7673_c1_g1~~TRINITY_DN7673_c1_g1_i1.p1  ORF type:complete len:342 (-),score=77.99 TRINITY_DN7673_c1_g1_i1:99-998(-)
MAGAVAGLGAGVLLCYLKRRREQSQEWRVLGDKAGGAHAPMMISKDGGCLLKPLDQGKRSQVEMAAYEALEHSSIGPFLCHLHGQRHIDGTLYMEIDSAYRGMQHEPKVTLDIKIGTKTWEDDAPAEKIAKETKKFNEIYATSSAADGFRVAGFKSGRLALNAENLKARKSLRTHEFGDWLLPAFFAEGSGLPTIPKDLAEPAGLNGTSDEPFRPDLVAAKEVLKRLKVFQAAAEMGFGGTLRAASLLFTRERRRGGKWNMYLIDLAHYKPCADDARDDNFCDGIKNLVKTWEAWLAKQ